MILFTGLNDWIVRNMLSEGFKEKITKEGIPLVGLIYKNNYDIYKEEVGRQLNMESYPQEIKQWDEYGDKMNSALRYLDYACISKLARVKNKTFRMKKHSLVADSFNKRARLSLKFKVLELLSFLSYEKKFVNKFEKSVKTLESYREASAFLREKRIKMIVSCSPETPYDTKWVIAGNELGLKTYAWIRSWDNITTKIAYIPQTNGIFAWSTLMEREFRNYYPNYNDTKVYKTGAVQFDGHFDKKNILDYNEFCKITGLNPQKKFVAYTTGGPHICKDEHILINRIAEKIDALYDVNKPQILVRVHPYAWNTNFKSDFTHPNIITWPPKDKMDKFKGGKTKGLLDDYKIMISTFYYQRLNINIASTVTIDSCVFNKPVINIGFDPEPPEYFTRSIAKYYEYDHYKPLVESGGVKVAYDIDEFGRIFKQYFENPGIDSENRKKIVEMECGDADGKAGERLAGKITELYGRIN